MEKKRIDFFDALKAICIVLVLFCHFPLLPDKSLLGNIFMTIAWCAVPCFMMVTGSIMHRPEREFSWKKHLRNQLKIYTVICVWRIVYLAAICLGSKCSYDVKSIIQYVFLFMELEGIKTGVIWYMKVYFMIMCFYPATFLLFKNDKGKKVLFYTMIICFVQGILIPSVDWLIGIMGVTDFSIYGLEEAFPYQYSFSGNTVNLLFYFLLGAFIYEYKDRIQYFFKSKSLNDYLPYVIFFCSVLALMLIKFNTTHSFLWGGVYLTSGYKRTSTLFLSFSVYVISLRWSRKYMKSAKFLSSQIGRYTLGVFYLHYILLAGLKEFLYPYLEKYYSFGLNCIKTVLILIICLIVTRIGRKIPLLSVLFK